MGAVYRARHAMLRRPTAVKLLPPERAGGHDVHRFEREVQATALLSHPNTVAIYDYGRTPDGIFYYAMEYLEGIDLEALVTGFGPQPPGRVVHLLGQVAGALGEAHAAGLVHRDVKPGNVILCQRGGAPDVAKVVDFGLVRELAGAGPRTETALDVVKGTPLYLSPEAITRPDRVDARSDLYAVGALAYFLLTGRHPFEGATVVEVCSHHLHTLPEPPSASSAAPCPADLEALVLACLEKTAGKAAPDGGRARRAARGVRGRLAVERARRARLVEPERQEGPRDARRGPAPRVLAAAHDRGEPRRSASPAPSRRDEDPPAVPGDAGERARPRRDRGATGPRAVGGGPRLLARQPRGARRRRSTRCARRASTARTRPRRCSSSAATSARCSCGGSAERGCRPRARPCGTSRRGRWSSRCPTAPPGTRSARRTSRLELGDSEYLPAFYEAAAGRGPRR